jgi:hypothetical protein
VNLKISNCQGTKTPYGINLLWQQQFGKSDVTFFFNFDVQKGFKFLDPPTHPPPKKKKHNWMNFFEHLLGRSKSELSVFLYQGLKQNQLQEQTIFNIAKFCDLALVDEDGNSFLHWGNIVLFWSFLAIPPSSIPKTILSTSKIFGMGSIRT